jgi:hypothetical protein
MKRISKYVFLVWVLAGIGAVECAAKKKPPVPVDPKFTAIQNISVLPIVDARAGKKADVNLEKLQGSVVNVLVKGKHYPANAAGGTGEAGKIAEEDLQQASPSFLKKLGSAEARWVMVVCVEDVAAKMTFGSTGNAEVSGYLFDKEGGQVVWSGKGVGQAGQGGLMGMAMKGMMKGEAIGAAISNLLAGLPSRPKPGK